MSFYAIKIIHKYNSKFKWINIISISPKKSLKAIELAKLRFAYLVKDVVIICEKMRAAELPVFLQLSKVLLEKRTELKKEYKRFSVKMDKREEYNGSIFIICMVVT